MHAQAGLDVRSSEVIYGGVSPERFFVERAPADYARGPLRLLYAGYIDQRRGLHTIVEALGLMPAPQRDRMHLSVAHAGPVVPDEYVDQHHRPDRAARTVEARHVPRSRPARRDAGGLCRARRARVRQHPERGHADGDDGGDVRGMRGPEHRQRRRHRAVRAGRHPALSEGPSVRAQPAAGGARDRIGQRVAEIALRGQQTVLREFTIEQMLETTADAFSRVGLPGSERPSARRLSVVRCESAHHARLSSREGWRRALRQGGVRAPRLAWPRRHRARDEQPRRSPARDGACLPHREVINGVQVTPAEPHLPVHQRLLGIRGAYRALRTGARSPTGRRCCRSVRAACGHSCSRCALRPTSSGVFNWYHGVAAPIRPRLAATAGEVHVRRHPAVSYRATVGCARRCFARIWRDATRSWR